ncbi:Spx/MgsR family RNA polymerase-binding regulatory protein [Mollicutes bacterium LVI A0039]|nr:Spx/MgsR family RNA polymerase-binding regulatory protein [Mollicutes bacterium LVI A0039]
MKATVYGYTKCSTVKKSLNFLKDEAIEFEHIDNVETKFSADQIKDLHVKSGLPLKRFFNTSGMLYRELQLKDKLPTMSEEEQYELLATDGMLVKRPILVTDKGVFPSFKAEKWLEIL